MPEDNVDQALGDFIIEVAGQETPRVKADPLGMQEARYQGEYIYDTVGPPPWIERVVLVNMISVERDAGGRPSHTWLCNVDHNGNEIAGVHYTAHAKMIPGQSYLMRETLDRDSNVIWQWIKVPVDEERWLYCTAGDAGTIIMRHSWPPATWEDDAATPPWDTIEQVQPDIPQGESLFDSNTEEEHGTEMLMLHQHGGVDSLIPYPDMGFTDSISPNPAPPGLRIMKCSDFGTIVVGQTLEFAIQEYSYTTYQARYVEDSELVCNTPGFWQGIVWINNHVEFDPHTITNQKQYTQAIHFWLSKDNGRSYEEVGLVDNISLLTERPYVQHLHIETDECTSGECNIFGGFCTMTPIKHDYDIDGSGVFDLSVVTRDGFMSAWAFQPEGADTDIHAIWVTYHLNNPPVNRGMTETVQYFLHVSKGGSTVTSQIMPPTPQVVTFDDHLGGSPGQIAIGLDDDNEQFVLYFQGLHGGMWVGRSPMNDPAGVVHWAPCPPDFYGGAIDKHGQACLGLQADFRHLLYTDDFGEHWKTLPPTVGRTGVFIQEA